MASVWGSRTQMDGNRDPHEGNNKNPSWLQGWGIWSLSNI